MTAEGSDQGGDLLEHGEATGTTAAPSAGASVERGTARKPARWAVFIGVAVGVVVLDQLSKAWLVASIDPGQAIQVLGDYLDRIFSQNPGRSSIFRDQALVFGVVLGVVRCLVPRPSAGASTSTRSGCCSAALQLLRPVPSRLRGDHRHGIGSLRF
jgi:hypothetical protein